MHPYPHIYRTTATGGPAELVSVTSPGLPDLSTAAPPEFDGPGGVWSPETLLCASIADCFILTFRAVARASKFEWTKLECRVEGTLERVDGTSRFTRFVTYATLEMASTMDGGKARQLLEKAEHGCLVANSLTGERQLIGDVVSA